jgi:hypothetical protein
MSMNVRYPQHHHLQSIISIFYLSCGPSISILTKKGGERKEVPIVHGVELEIIYSSHQLQLHRFISEDIDKRTNISPTV